MEAYAGSIWWVRLVLQRGLALVYLAGFLSALDQGRALLGARGLLPIPEYLVRVSFLRAPTLFHAGYHDRLFTAVALAGTGLSLVALAGLSEAGPLWLSVSLWLALWALYLSIVNVGQVFYGFGWESMLLEAGFFASFLGPSSMAPSAVPVLILRWMLFRVELGAGLIKLRHDRCWRDLTCLYFHYETQPLPNPLSWFFHRMPKPLHRFSVLVSHFVQIVVPFGLFAPQPVSSIAGGLAIFHQVWLIVSGNYAWLNWLTIVLGVSALSCPAAAPVHLHARPDGYDTFALLLAGVVIALSVKPVLNLASKDQAMNLTYNPLHLVGTYGAFGSVTRERYEVVLEGTEDEDPRSEQTRWIEYEHRAKPGPVTRMPPQVAPYHLRLDWLLWFLPFSTQAYDGHVVTFGYEPWFVTLVERLLEADRPTLRLFRRDPFAGRAPRFVRARYYRYQYTGWAELRRTGAWWRRTLIGDYMRPVSVADVQRSRTAPASALAHEANPVARRARRRSRRRSGDLLLERSREHPGRFTSRRRTGSAREPWRGGTRRVHLCPGRSGRGQGAGGALPVLHRRRRVRRRGRRGLLSQRMEGGRQSRRGPGLPGLLPLPAAAAHLPALHRARRASARVRPSDAPLRDGVAGRVRSVRTRVESMKRRRRGVQTTVRRGRRAGRGGALEHRLRRAIG